MTPKPFNGRFREARVQRFQAKHNAKAQAAAKRARKAARKARKR